MANTHVTLTSLFTDIADAIRAKTGGSDTIVADNFPAAISAIDTQENLDDELSAQDAKIAELQSILESKAKATVTVTDDGVGNVTITSTDLTLDAGPNLISFTIVGTDYHAEEGMTWAEWIDSSYNTDGFAIKESNGEYMVVNSSDWWLCDADSNSIYSEDVIITGYCYEEM